MLRLSRRPFGNGAFNGQHKCLRALRVAIAHRRVEDARIIITVGTGEMHGLVRLSVAIATNLYLGTRGIELGAEIGRAHV